MGDGLKWATMNVGATKPEEPGDFFSWAGTASKESYTWDNCPYYDGQGNYTKYNADDNLKVLQPTDDAASYNWKGTWRMPTADEWKALFNTEIFTWEWDDANEGYTVTSKVNGYVGNKIFIPGGGGKGGNTTFFNSGYGNYWSSSLDQEHDGCAKCMIFVHEDSKSLDLVFGQRRYGFSVRPVSD